MPRRDRRLFLLLLVSSVGAGLSLPALSQDAPESLLPPGFGTTPPPPAPPPGTAGTPAPTVILPESPAALGEESLAEEEGEEEKDKPVELPDAARRSLDVVGPLLPDQGGLGSGAFGRANGRFLTRLMNRIDAPIASRWASILLRRALMSRVPTPANVAPADWVAQRAWLLLRMGEADAARMLVDRVDTDRFSPRMYVVAQQVALASGDPSGLCAIAGSVPPAIDDKSWIYARAICAALSGDASSASMLLDRGRKRGRRDIDYLLAEKVVGAGTNSRRAATIEWDDVDLLNSWRFGLAAAVGLQIPDRLINTPSGRYHAWLARAPMYAPEARIKSALIAARLGVLSSAALTDLYAQIDDREGDSGRDAAQARLRTAFVGGDADERERAIRNLWEDAGEEFGTLYAAQILTARTAASLKPSDDFSSDYTNLIAAMFAGGFDLQAMRWATVIEAQGASADPAWAMLAVGAPRRVVDLGYGRIDDFCSRAGDDGRHRAQLLIASLGGLGRLSAQDEARLTESYGLAIARQTAFTRAIDRAAARGEQGTVAVLAAAGLQTRDWKYVPALHLYHIVAALRRTGNEPAARMIAAEAMTRS